MQQINNMSYLLWRQDLLVRVQMLAAKYSEAGIDPDGLFCLSDDELAGRYAYLKRLNELGDANQ
ncbi:hypothetical protein [uncultured Cycloclasticus sp.]|jgi:hypothetical protein|uniref:hypothetical protein n=1 Tax=uncultured Cycloclasticus sp. TaxID=172194 RepID=UPI0025858727|nr:hypothetical protein [uncultured Cycloclasticus sp.]